MADVFDQAESKVSGDVFDQAAVKVQSGPGRGGRRPTQEQIDSSRAAQHTRDQRYGIPTLATGIGELSSPGYRKKGIHDTLMGAGELALPAAIPETAAGVIPVAGAAAGGWAGSKVGHGAAKLFGASNDTADLVGDAAGAAGAFEGGTGFRGARYLLGGLKSLTPEWVTKFNEAGKLKAGIAKPSPKSAAALPTSKPVQSPSRLAKNDAPPPAPPPPAAPGISPSRLAKNETHPPPPASVPDPKPVASPSQYAKNWKASGGTATSKPSATAAAPGAPVTVDAPHTDEAAKSAAELMRAVGISADEAGKATPEQWKMIEQQVGGSFDRQQAIEHLKGMDKPQSKPSPKSQAEMKPTPGGDKVQSTMTPEARAARAEEHATKLAQLIRKSLPGDKIPAPSDDAAWKVLEAQTGTEATPAVRKAAIDKANKLWSEGPRSAGDLQKRRADYFAKNSAQ